MNCWFLNFRKMYKHIDEIYSVQGRGVTAGNRTEGGRSRAQTRSGQGQGRDQNHDEPGEGRRSLK